MSTRLAIVGAGWAGLAAAVAALRAGHHVTVFEASRQVGGRARTLPLELPDGVRACVDNGQHILVGAYRDTLATIRAVGVEPRQVLLRMPLTLRFPDGCGLALPPWPAPVDAVTGIVRAKGWRLADKFALLAAVTRWRSAAFECPASASVADLCQCLTERVRSELIEPLCVAALNTPAPRASGAVFLRVLRDTLFERGGSNLLLPVRALGELFPQPAAAWLRERGVVIELGRRCEQLAPDGTGWHVDAQRFDAVVLACPAREAARLVGSSPVSAGPWLQTATSLEHEAIATVYAFGGARLSAPLLALRSDARRPAQFVFDRSQLGGPDGLLAFVVSACAGDGETVQAQVMAQARELGWSSLQPVRTVIEKRATFAATPGLRRPPAAIAPGLVACGDYVEGPYPATLEGAVRSALAAVALVS